MKLIKEEYLKENQKQVIYWKNIRKRS